MWLWCQELQQGRLECQQLDWEESKLYIILCILTSGLLHLLSKQGKKYEVSDAVGVCANALCLLVISVAMCGGVFVGCACALCAQAFWKHTCSLTLTEPGVGEMGYPTPLLGYCI